MAVSPVILAPGSILAVSEARDSSTRVTVVPTAITRPALLILSAAPALTEYLSECMTCSPMCSTETGRKVPTPTCRVMKS